MFKENDSTSASTITSTDSSAPEYFSSDEKYSGTRDHTSEDEAQPYDFSSHMKLLEPSPEATELAEIKAAPLFTETVRRRASDMASSGSGLDPFPQYGLLGGDVSANHLDPKRPGADPRIFYNVSAPSSVFICGSQGSGKSHSLSCLLENCLISSEANVLSRPLTGVVFHYDTFVSDNGGEPCEAAYLASSPRVKVRVLCAPTNLVTITKVYSKIPNVTVEPLRLNESDLNTKRMMSLMAVDDSQGIPLYLHVIQRILRDLRLQQQQQGSLDPNDKVAPFQYSEFKRLLELENLTPAQLAPLKQRLDTLESFMVGRQAYAYGHTETWGHSQKKTKGVKREQGTSWNPEPGRLTIVDLSCPCVQAQTACSLFNICLSLFLQQDNKIGRVVALDEAHKYMGGGALGAESPDSRALTDNLLQTIRLQRHQACRIFISTQEPTVSPALLDLCSVTIVHRFSSPAWLQVLRQHLAGVSSSSLMLEKAMKAAADAAQQDGSSIATIRLGGPSATNANPAVEIFSHIVKLRVGEALVFAPSAAIGINSPLDAATGPNSSSTFRRLGSDIIKMRTRSRVTTDGGRSIMAD